MTDDWNGFGLGGGRRAAMTLYSSPTCVHCHRTRIVLAEKGIASGDLLDAYQPTAAVKERLARERKRFLDEVQSALSPAAG